MKSLLILCISIFSLAPAHAATPSTSADKMDMTCITEFPTTSFAIREVDNTVIVEVFHHNGTRFMPVFDGLATPNDMVMLVEKAKTLSSLPTIQRFEWPREKCQIDDTMIESCFGSTDVQDQNGHKVKAWSFISSLVTEKSFAGKYTSYRLALDINVDGQSYSMPMKYAENECYPAALMARELRKGSQPSK